MFRKVAGYETSHSRPKHVVDCSMHSRAKSCDGIHRKTSCLPECMQGPTQNFLNATSTCPLPVTSKPSCPPLTAYRCCSRRNFKPHEESFGLPLTKSPRRRLEQSCPMIRRGSAFLSFSIQCRQCRTCAAYQKTRAVPSHSRCAAAAVPDAFFPSTAEDRCAWSGRHVDGRNDGTSRVKICTYVP